MKMELLDDHTVKILLSRDDMLQFRLTYAEMDEKSPETRRVILTLMDTLRDRCDVDFSKGRLFIEAFPYADGGCILYVHLCAAHALPGESKRQSGFDTPLIFCFRDLSALTALSVQMQARYGHVILQSVLYLRERTYYLLLYTYFKMDDAIIRLSGEYGHYCGKGGVRCAMVQEHARLLIAENALQTIIESLE